MSADRQRVEAVLAGASALDDARARAAYLDKACGSDDELRCEVESLLEAHDEAGAFLGAPAPGAPLGIPSSGGRGAGPAEAGTPGAPAPLAEQPGDRIGRYKLLEKIGEGGMGSVWMAQQEEPVRRRVALKVIKLGMDTQEVVTRFEAERQALALMDHPNIARVFDGGATTVAVAANWRSPQTSSQAGSDRSAPRKATASEESAADTSPPLRETPAGRPYFVMELVRGIRITDYCDQHRLTTAQRLDLFTHVCHAVQHAHQKGIIHRDLKPSNILVAVQDDRPVVKVIDFGIAKATEGRLTDKTLFTRFMQFLGTPAYMSPEQAELTSIDIDTRSDIYSLGVLLYELLTGRTPFDSKELLAAGLDEMRRVIRETEPMKPSTAVERELELRVEKASRPQLSTQTPLNSRANSQLKHLSTALRGDLDWIVMKCLEKDRTRRYETANGLVQDLQRHLNSEPVQARPPSALYRWRKFARKHRIAVTMAAGILVLLAAASVISTSLALWAGRERDAAQESDADTRAVLGFLDAKVLSAARPEGQEGGLGRETTLRAAVEAAEPEVAALFTNRPLVEASVRQSLGLTYFYLGDNTQALRQFSRTLALRDAKLGRNDPNTAEAMHNVAMAAHAAGQVSNALFMFETTLQRQKSIHGLNHRATLVTANNLARTLVSAGRLDEALPLLEDTVARLRTAFGQDDADTLIAQGSLAWAYDKARQPGKSLALSEDTVRLLRAKRGAEHPVTLTAMNNLALLHQQTGQNSNAFRAFEEILAIRERKLGPYHRDTIGSLHNLAYAHRLAGRLTNAMDLFERALDLSRTHQGSNHPVTIATANNLAQTYVYAGQAERAVPLLEDTLRRQLTETGTNHPDSRILMGSLAWAYGKARMLEKSILLSEEIVRILIEAHGPDDPDTLTVRGNLALVYQQGGRPEAAVLLLEEVVERRLATQGPGHSDTLDTMLGLARLRAQSKDFARMEKLLSEWTERMRPFQPQQGGRLAEALALLGESLLEQNRFAEAETPVRESVTLLESLSAGGTAVFRSQFLLGRCLLGQKDHDGAERRFILAYEGLISGAPAPSSAVQAQLPVQIAEHLVRLYEAAGNPEEAVRWRQKLR